MSNLIQSEIDLSQLGFRLDHHLDRFEGHHYVDREGFEIRPDGHVPIDGGHQKNNELDLSNEQSKAWHRLTDIRHKDITRVVYGGQAGGGKSFLIALWLDFMCNEYPETRYYLGRETLKDIKESVLLTFFDVTKITGSTFKYNEQKSKLTYTNGSEIYLLETFAYPSDPNFDSFGSREYTAGAIEEGITVTKRAADILISRTRYKHDVYNLYPKQLITCNPGDGWIKDDIVIPQIEGTPRKKNEIFIQATLASNPNKEFSERYTKTLEENLTSYDRERLLNGNWNAKPKSGAEFLKEFNQDKHVIKGLKDKYDPYSVLHISFDENLHPYITCLIFQIYKQGEDKIIRQLMEFCLPPPRNRRAEVAKEIVRVFYPGHHGGVMVYGDATSLKDETDKLPGENFFTDIMSGIKVLNPRLKVPLKNPPVASKGSFLNLILEKQYRNIIFQVDSDCKKSINDYAYAVEDEDGTILKKRITDPNTKISYEKHGHNIDAMSYFICEAFINDFNYYLSGGVTHQYSVGNDREYKFQRE
jgi:hypothetical protein